MFWGNEDQRITFMRLTWFRRFLFAGVIVLLATGSVGLAQKVKPLPAEAPRYNGVCQILNYHMPWWETGAGAVVRDHLLKFFDC